MRWVRQSLQCKRRDVHEHGWPWPDIQPVDGENGKEGKGEKKRGRESGMREGRREALNNPAVATQSGTGIGMSS